MVLVLATIRFLKSAPGISWADLPEGRHAMADDESSDDEGVGAAEGEDEDDKLFRSTASLVTKSQGRFQPGRIDIARCPDANIQEPSKVSEGILLIPSS